MNLSDTTCDMSSSFVNTIKLVLVLTHYMPIPLQRSDCNPIEMQTLITDLLVHSVASLHRSMSLSTRELLHSMVIIEYHLS